MASKHDFQTRIAFVRQQDEAVVLVFAQIILFACGCLEAETLDVRIVLLVGIVEYGGPYFVRIVFLQYAYAIVIVIVQVEVGGIELSAVLYDKDGVFALEFSEIFSAPVVVET